MGIELKQSQSVSSIGALRSQSKRRASRPTINKPRLHGSLSDGVTCSIAPRQCDSAVLEVRPSGSAFPSLTVCNCCCIGPPTRPRCPPYLECLQLLFYRYCQVLGCNGGDGLLLGFHDVGKGSVPEAKVTEKSSTTLAAHWRIHNCPATNSASNYRAKCQGCLRMLGCSDRPS